MEFAKIAIYPYKTYSCCDSSNIKMRILGDFLVDLGIPGTELDNWIFDDDTGLLTGGNSMQLEKYGSNIHITDIYDGDGNIIEIEDAVDKIIMSRESLADLINDWKEKVCKTRPQKVIITKEGDVFTLTTSN